MITFRLICFLFANLLLFQVYGQFESSIEKAPESVRSINQRIFRPKFKKGEIVKGPETFFPDGYPLKYSRFKKVFNRKGFLVERKFLYQRDTIVYNESGLKAQVILYPFKEDGHVTITYSYDNHGNTMEEILDPSHDGIYYQIDGSYYFADHRYHYEYENYYLNAANSEIPEFDQIQMQVRKSYRVYTEGKNLLLKEKYLTIRKNPYPYKSDSIFVYREFTYRDTMLISIQKVTRNRSGVLDKEYVTNREDEYQYSESGNLLEVKHISDGIIKSKDVFEYDSNGVLTSRNHEEYSYKKTSYYVYNEKADLIRYETFRKGKLKNRINLDYEYNDYGEWIKCIHSNVKGKPLYLVEREIHYY